MPSLSVIIPHYGDPQLAGNLAEQLLPQLKAHDEMIIVDDCSPIPAPEIWGVKVVRRGKNGGFGAANNSAASVAVGSWLVLLNSDLQVEDTFLQQVREATATVGPHVLGPQILDSAGEPVVSARQFLTTCHQFWNWLTPIARWRTTDRVQRWLGYDLDAHAARAPESADWLLGAALFLPRAAFESVGGFDERFYMSAEEMDLQRRLARVGVTAVYIPDIEVRHLGGGSSDPKRLRTWLSHGLDEYATKWGYRNRRRLALTGASLINWVWNCARRVRNRDVHPLGSLRTELRLIWRADDPRDER